MFWKGRFVQPQWLPVWTSTRSVHIANPGWQAEAKHRLCMYLWLCVFPLGLLSLLHSSCLPPSLLVPPSPSLASHQNGEQMCRGTCASLIYQAALSGSGCNYRDKPLFFLYRHLCVGQRLKWVIMEFLIPFSVYRFALNPYSKSPLCRRLLQFGSFSGVGFSLPGSPMLISCTLALLGGHIWYRFHNTGLLYSWISHILTQAPGLALLGVQLTLFWLLHVFSKRFIC